MTDTTVYACPECDSTKEMNQRPRNPDPSARWRCQECGATFERPRRRPPRQHNKGGLSPGGQVLDDADPHEYP